MKRMFSKSQIANMSGTQWYKHKISLNDSSLLEMITLFKEQLKDITNVKTYAMIFTNGSGPSVPRNSSVFPTMRCQTPGVFTITYVNSSNQLATYTLNVSEINTEEITTL